ncbi:hypothetical protein N0V93_008008 [Gnomoniopsis smithogilvyi]|uniref:Uncharacterized protein n=1 Tax=Gnomoniopsis smithogilvyi TaxID=1191159 RepID=A0A9W8YLU9_9PEZI|nr:hypothetical protein N0V93_008008 [Gnomoniopsis smithogilvyi]
MKWELSVVALLATLTVAAPAPQQKAADDVNNAANNGQGGLEAAAKAEAAVLLTENGDVGAVDEGEDFEDAVQKIVDSGNEDDVDTLELAGIDVDEVVDGAAQGNQNNQNANKANQNANKNAN